MDLCLKLEKWSSDQGKYPKIFEDNQDIQKLFKFICDDLNSLISELREHKEKVSFIISQHEKFNDSWLVLNNILYGKHRAICDMRFVRECGDDLKEIQRQTKDQNRFKYELSQLVARYESLNDIAKTLLVNIKDFGMITYSVNDHCTGRMHKFTNGSDVIAVVEAETDDIKLQLDRLTKMSLSRIQKLTSAKLVFDLETEKC